MAVVSVSGRNTISAAMWRWPAKQQNGCGEGDAVRRRKMRLGRGTGFPITLESCGRISTGTESAWRARVLTARLIFALRVARHAFTRPNEINRVIDSHAGRACGGVCEQTRLIPPLASLPRAVWGLGAIHKRKPFIGDSLVPHALRARGPPSRCPIHPVFGNGFAKPATSTRRNR
jgi:hypothetical protein